MIHPRNTCSVRNATDKARGFTLVEIIVGVAIGVALMAAIATLFVATSRIVYKNQQIDAGVTNSRFVQERLYKELSIAISQKRVIPGLATPLMIRPEFSDASGTTPARYATVTYRVPVGSYARVATASPSDSDTLTLTWSEVDKPKSGDFLLMDEPDLGTGILIESVSPTASGTLTVKLASTLNAGTFGKDKADNIGAALNKFVRIQRERKFATIAPKTETVNGIATTSPVTELHWYESTADAATRVILSQNVDAANRYLFARAPDDTSATILAEDPAVSWKFTHKTAETKTGRMAGVSNADFYETSSAEGLIMPKSGDPLNTASPEDPGGPPTTTSTKRPTTTTTPKTKTPSDSPTTTKMPVTFDG